MTLTCMLRVTAQFIITDVTAVSWRQLQKSQLHFPGPVSRYRRAHEICAFIISISLDRGGGGLALDENMTNEGYMSMPQNLIRFLKDDRRCWVKQRELLYWINV